VILVVAAEEEGVVVAAEEEGVDINVTMVVEAR
jgi:hypothetical protein